MKRTGRDELQGATGCRAIARRVVPTFTASTNRRTIQPCQGEHSHMRTLPRIILLASIVAAVTSSGAYSTALGADVRIAQTKTTLSRAPEPGQGMTRVTAPVNAPS